ncbi:MAG: Hsp70 family protein [Bryobacteraceae bacterium]|nr:Hsp70 family protein [Bryobacteraceae bacterium]
MADCPKCRAWTIGAEDIFCSWCGHSFVEIAASLDRSSFHYDNLQPPRRRLSIENRSQATLRIEDVRATAPWIEVKWDGRPFELQPGGPPATLQYRPKIYDLPENTYHRGTILIRPSVGEPIELELNVTPSPAFRVSAVEQGETRQPPAFDVIADGQKLETNQLRLEVTRGMAKLESVVVTEGSEWAKTLPAGGLTLPVTLSAQSGSPALADFLLDCDEEALMSAPAETSCTVEFRFNGGLTHSEKVQVRRWDPPALLVAEEVDLSIAVTAGHPGEIVWTLRNRSFTPLPGASGVDPDTRRAPLVVQRIDVSVDEEADREQALLRPATDLQFPLRIPGGGEQRLVYRFRTSASTTAVPGELGIGSHLARFLVDASYFTARRALLKKIEVRPLGVFQGILAIDFGTSNSCVAAFNDLKFAPEMVRVARQTTNPSVILYQTPKSEAPPEKEATPAQVRIGAQVAMDDNISATYFRSVVRSPKLKLGKEGAHGQFEVGYSQADVIHVLPARQVVADYLRGLRQAAEAACGATFRTVHFSYPAAFFGKQLTELYQAAIEAFGNVETYFVTEPVAAALDFLFLTAREKLPKTLAVFDFGGGTTDLSLLEISQDGDLRVRQLDHHGTPFGGQNLTQQIADHAWQECLKFEQASAAESAVLTRDFQAPDAFLRLAARRNIERLFAWAERVKLILVENVSKKVEDLVEAIPPVELIGVIPGPRFAPRVYTQVQQITPKVEVFSEWLRVELHRIATNLEVMVHKKNHLDRPDCILLSGKSSKIPVVREILAQKFPPPVEIHLADEPKECVVRGICVTHMLRADPTMYLDVGERSGEDLARGADVAAVGQRIGWRLGARFNEIFPAGKPIPKDGLRREIDIKLRPNMLLNMASCANTFDSGEYRSIGVFRPDPEAVPANVRFPLPAKLVFHLNPEEEVTLKATLEDGSEVPFKRDP